MSSSVAAADPRMGANRVRASLVRQFGHPSGFWGHLVGWTMAWRPSNRQRNAWTVEQLGLRTGERVLEVGFGPGLALAHAARQVGPTGLVAGVDPSEVMLGQARRRNAAAVAEGRVDLRVGTVEDLPEFGEGFDAILAVNTIGFWQDPRARLERLRTHLRPGGRIAITVQPRSARADATTSARVREQLVARLGEAGFASVTAHQLPLDPPAVCVTGVRGVSEG